MVGMERGVGQTFVSLVIALHTRRLDARLRSDSLFLLTQGLKKQNKTQHERCKEAALMMLTKERPR